MKKKLMKMYQLTEKIAAENNEERSVQ